MKKTKVRKKNRRKQKKKKKGVPGGGGASETVSDSAHLFYLLSKRLS